MKNRILSFIILAAGMVTSCNTDAEFSEFIPTHALSTLVKSATATCGSETVVGTVDNATHEIQFVFVNNSNFSDVAVTLEYATRAIRKEGAPEEGQITKNAEAGSENDLTVNGTVVEFKYGELPEARYYRFKMLKNFYAAFGTAMNQYWSGRINYFALSEVELWRYNTEE